MKNEHTREAVSQVLRTVLDSETDTHNLYEDYLNRLVDEEVRRVFTILREEEAGHAEHAKALLERIERPPVRK
jgi:rubrerythrin